MEFIKDLGMRFPKPTSKRKYRFGLYRCHCGKEVEVDTSSVKRGTTKQCKSCATKKARAASKGTTKHGGTGTRLHNIWNGMKDRCTRKNHPHFKHYGGKGITVCNEWQDFSVFRDWAMANGYTDVLTIERKENDKGYNPNNCTWATRKEQSNNQTFSLLNKFSKEELRYIQLQYLYTRLSKEDYCSIKGLSDVSLYKLLNGGFEGVPAIIVKTKKRHDNTSGYPGVGRSGKKWSARCIVNGKRTYLGLFNTPEEANEEIQKRKDR